MKNDFFKPIVIISCLLTTACSVSAPWPDQYAKVSVTPDLSPYTQFELYAQNAAPTDTRQQGRLRFLVASSQFEAYRADGAAIGRLHVQPEECRDDPDAACQRRFVINGRLHSTQGNFSCVVPVRNDTNTGYQTQTLSGLCQSQYGRAYTIQIFAP